MGLTCIIQYYDETTNEYSVRIPPDIAIKLQPINNIITFEISKYDDYYFISFSGKMYSHIITLLTNQSLYCDLDPTKLKMMYLALEAKLSDFNYREEVMEHFNGDNMFYLTDWLELLLDIHIPSPDELIGFKELFKICYENNLQIYASY